MPAIPISNHIVLWKKGSFIPSGKLRFVGGQKAYGNPWVLESTETWGARIIVGLNVRDEPKWTIGDLVKITRALREEQQANPGATFIAQKGVYKHKSGQRTVEEDGGQVIILNLDGTPADKFLKQMLQLGEMIAKNFDQESVILESQMNGIVQGTYTVTPL